MTDVAHRQVETNGITMHVAEAGDPSGELVVLLHGFPEVWFSWRHQLPALAAAGYHAIAPDQRGYGRTDRPEPIDAYDMHDLTDDVAGLLDAYGHEQAVIVGHDWGALVAWGMAQRMPERMRAVATMSVPFAPRGSRSLIEVLRELMGDRFYYILYFQEPGVADADLGKDPREAMRRFLCATLADGTLVGGLPAEGTTFWDWMLAIPSLPAWLSEEELDVFATEFERTGFTGGINWYRNFHRNWELSESYGTRQIEMPAAFIAGADDPAGSWPSPPMAQRNRRMASRGSRPRSASALPGSWKWRM